MVGRSYVFPPMIGMCFEATYGSHGEPFCDCSPTIAITCLFSMRSLARPRAVAPSPLSSTVKSVTGCPPTPPFLLMKPTQAWRAYFAPLVKRGKLPVTLTIWPMTTGEPEGGELDACGLPDPCGPLAAAGEAAAELAATDGSAALAAGLAGATDDDEEQAVVTSATARSAENAAP